MKKFIPFITLFILLLLVSCGSERPVKTSIGNKTLDLSKSGSDDSFQLGSDDSLIIKGMEDSKSYVIITESINSKGMAGTSRASSNIKGAVGNLNDYLKILGEKSSNCIIAPVGSEFESLGSDFGYTGIRDVKLKNLKTTNGCINLAKDDNKLAYYTTQTVDGKDMDFYIFAGFTNFDVNASNTDVKIKEKGEKLDLYLLRASSGKHRSIGSEFYGFSDNSGNLQLTDKYNWNGLFQYDGSANHVNFIRAFVSCNYDSKDNRGGKKYSILVNPKCFSTDVDGNTLALTNTVNTFHISSNDINDFSPDKKYVLEFSWNANNEINWAVENSPHMSIRPDYFAFKSTGSANCVNLKGKRVWEPFYISSSENKAVLYLGEIPLSNPANKEETEILLSQYFRIQSEIPQQLVEGGWGNVTLREINSAESDIVQFVSITDLKDSITIQRVMTASDISQNICLFPIVFNDTLKDTQKKVTLRIQYGDNDINSWTDLPYEYWEDNSKGYGFKPFLYGANCYSTDSADQGFMPTSKELNDNPDLSYVDAVTLAGRPLENFYLYCYYSNKISNDFKDIRLYLTIEKADK